MNPETRWLLIEAVDRIDNGNPEGAIWRVADALGMLCEAMPEESKRQLPTGLGFALAVEKKEGSDSGISNR